MELVKDSNNILANLLAFELGLNSTNAAHSNSYRNFVRDGICYIPYNVGEEIHFAPSRFIGYINQDIETHKSSNKHGRETTNKISKILEHDPTTSDELERLFDEFCIRLGIKTPETGKFGRDRRYWNSDIFSLDTAVSSPSHLTDDSPIPETERAQLTSARIGQGLFRKRLIKQWGGCAVTGSKFLLLLRASHIKPWSQSSDRERLDPYNGLLLTPNLDTLFDLGFISFTNDGHLLRSPQLGEADLAPLGFKLGTQLKFDARHHPYLAFHRAHRFRA